MSDRGNWQDGFGWTWFRRDPEYPHLAEYIDYVMRGAGDSRAGVVGGVVGGLGGIVGGSIGVLLGALQLPVWTIAFPIALWAVATVGVVSWYLRTRVRQDPGMRAARKSAKSLTWRLWHAQYAGGMRSVLNRDDIERLEKGARLWSESRRLFIVSGFGQRSPGVYAAAMERTVTAMESGLLKMLALAGGGDRTGSAMESVLEQMEELAHEVETLTNSRMQSETVGDKSDTSITAALQHLRHLRNAEDEIETVRQRQS